MKEAGIPLGDLQDHRIDGAPLDVEFKGKMRPYQQEAVDHVLEHHDGVICAPTGSGKTIMALGLIAELGRSTLILVHTNALLHQMVERIEQFLGITPGIVGGGRERPGPITVATVQTMLRRPKDFLSQDFGLVILDEAHHCPASTFRKVIQRFPARYRVGFTATPERKDRLHPMLFATVGPIIYRVDPDMLRAQGAILSIEVHPIQTNFYVEYKGDHVALVKAISTDVDRNQLLLESISSHHRKCSLVLTDRVQHAIQLTAQLNLAGTAPTACMVGETPDATRADIFAALQSGKVQILVATTALVGEGFDCPALDTLFLTIPTGNKQRLTQIIGRILRPHPGKATPIVVDFVDHQIPAMVRQYATRKRLYRQNMKTDEPDALVPRPLHETLPQAEASP
jgi:superfamily II DNA or RNA helicase